MQFRELPIPVVSLIHHVELHQSDWWVKSLQRMILAVFWMQDSEMTAQQLANQIRGAIGYRFDNRRLVEGIQHLIRQNELHEVSQDLYRLSESCRSRLAQEVREGEANEAEAKAAFLRAIEQFAPDFSGGESFWTDFVQRLLIPMVRSMGARTYEMISGGSLNHPENLPRLEEILQAQPQKIHGPLRSAVLAFLNPKNPVVRSYVLRHLNTHFFLEAGNLTEESIRSITKPGSKISFEVFLDTNFLFSVLGLHENPADEAVQSLADTIQKIAKSVSVKMRVLQWTLVEARTSLARAEAIVQDLKVTPNLAQAALNIGLSGIVSRYIRACKDAKKPLSPPEYFRPYTSDLLLIARNKGIELWNEDPKPYISQDECLLDIAARWEEEQRRQRQGAAKGRRPRAYELIEHDVRLWHFVRGKRPVVIESPLDAEYWVATLDHSLLKFDDQKRTSQKSKIPSCVHPTALIQMLQFWVPRSQEFEEAVLASFRLPFIFAAFDADAEKATIRILKALSRHEDVADLPVETVSSLLTNQALRQRLSYGERPDVEKDQELISAALVEENRSAKAQIEEQSVRLREEESRAASREAKIGKLEEELRQSELRSVEMQQRLAREREVHDELGKSLRSLREESASLLVSRKTRQLVVWLLAVVLVGVVVLFLLREIALR